MKDKSGKELFTAPRWTEPIAFQKIGHKELTKEEKEYYRRTSLETLRKLGVKLDENEIEDEDHAE